MTLRKTKATIAIIAATGLLIESTGCAGWMAVDRPWPITLATGTSHKVQVRRLGGWRMQADSARATQAGLMVFRGAAVDTIPIQEIDEVEVRRVDAWKTVVVVGGTVLGFVVLGLIGCAGGGCD